MTRSRGEQESRTKTKMSQERGTICKFNQTGFCKFKQLCKKEHVKEICQNQSDCKNEMCTLRHPKICRHFSRDGSCRHHNRCAYMHTEKIKESDAQQKLNEILAMALTTQIKELAEMRNEMIELKLKVQHLENNNQIKDVNKVNNEQKNTLKEADNVQLNQVKEIYQCDKCEYKCEKNITLIKHKNTKHTGKDKFHCDQCNYSCPSKRSLKKHMSHKHEGLNKKAFMQCVKCDKTFQNKTELETHMEDHHSLSEENQEEPCECTEDTVCDKCLNYWVQKSHSK